ncbi:PorT family protein [Elizabethkingia meningoseptica]|uniref:porin family protein n=1 Tax=Elizabethkingia meningoseptica TaxID=238 RepID=UPI0009999282|nr:porin family protein [Elizabethkingia meningoseptica]EJK5327362.1 PorT family protein [Elizabethkingia meningoseptica]MDE5466997.1 PorT family protein [Elizabethkingia meningoseptica]MDE5473773.1 PorT family protein [Elizabethkingia meningoseptica]MDE5477206.1 PorT family protein [Elizabethkingia meningoseptica]MDE5484316.1 PorT family protein [Elizabethkingia meningoseptica]
MKKIIRSVVLTFGISGISFAQNTDTASGFFNNIDYQIRANYSIGGSAPLGMPREIRKIESYNPTLALGLEANATKWISDDHKWGVRVGVRVESKGMKTKAEVKNYLTEIAQDNSKVRGYYTGKVQTNVKNAYITVPVSAVYHLSDKWNFYGGLYMSGLIDKGFDGYVSDGYLRQNTPTGAKITFDEGSTATYDFSDQVRRFQWGFQLGAEWSLNNHFTLFPEFTYGINGLLNKNFDAISFSMHNIYMNLGFGYKF